jgi:hypothetical protein
VENVQLGSWEWVEVVVFDSAFKKKKKKWFEPTRNMMHFLRANGLNENMFKCQSKI